MKTRIFRDLPSLSLTVMDHVIWLLRLDSAGSWVDLLSISRSEHSQRISPPSQHGTRQVTAGPNIPKTPHILTALCQSTIRQNPKRLFSANFSTTNQHSIRKVHCQCRRSKSLLVFEHLVDLGRPMNSKWEFPANISEKINISYKRAAADSWTFFC